MERGERMIKKPTYPGGRTAMDSFIKEQLKYPDKALADKVEGTVVVVIDIDQNGFVKKGRVKKSLGHGCDEEAVRVCKLLKFSTAAKRKNKRITFHRTINIHFRLPKVKKKAVANKPKAQSVIDTGSGLQISYTYVPKKK